MRYFLLLILITVFPLSMHSIDNVNLNYLQTCIKKHCFLSRIADTPTARAKGLMGETYLPRNEAMLFVFPIEGLPSFWMKKTKIPLDILFINDKDIIVYTVKNAQPCDGNDCPVYQTTRRASKVLEINGGLANELGIRVGDAVGYFIEDN